MILTEDITRSSKWFKIYKLLYPWRAEEDIKTLVGRESVYDEIHALLDAFIWDDTPQGHAYWSTLHIEIYAITDADIRNMTLKTNLERI